MLQEFQSLLVPQCFFSVVQAKSATERALMFNYNFCHFSQFIVYNVFIDVLGKGVGGLLCSYFWFITDWLWINKFAILQSSKVTAKQLMYIFSNSLAVCDWVFSKSFNQNLGIVDILKWIEQEEILFNSLQNADGLRD